MSTSVIYKYTVPVLRKPRKSKFERFSGFCWFHNKKKLRNRLKLNSSVEKKKRKERTLVNLSLKKNGIKIPRKSDLRGCKNKAQLSFENLVSRAFREIFTIENHVSHSIRTENEIQNHVSLKIPLFNAVEGAKKFWINCTRSLLTWL